MYDFPDVVEAQVFVSVIESVAEAPNSTYTEIMKGAHISISALEVSSIHLTVVVSIGATDVGRINSRLSRGGEGVRASSSSGSAGGKPRKGLEIKSQCTNIIRNFAERRCQFGKRIIFTFSRK